MKISSLQENLKNGLSIVSHIAGKNVNLPILSNVMIEARAGEIKLITTDLEMGITCFIRGKVEEEGIYTVESKILSDYVSLLANKKVDIIKTNGFLNLVCENYKTSVKGQDSDDFPLIPKVDKNECYTADIEELKKAISQVIFSVSSNETRVELGGVFFCFEKNKLTLAATDSYRLAEKEIKIETSVENERKIIVPAKTLQELSRILSAVSAENLNSEKEIKFYISDNQILFTVGNVELISRIIEGQYPNYKQIIPNEEKTKIFVDRKDLVRAVKAASLFSKTGINDVNLDFPKNGNKVVVSSASSQAGENITELEASVSGDDNGVVVNCRYLLDGLNNISEEDVKIAVVDGSTPCVLKPRDKEDYIYIIMPIKQ